MFIVLLLLQCNGVDDGARTHDHRNHNPGLYQLSYAHHYNTTFTLYPDDVGTPCRIRTRDLRLRRPLLYPTELRAHVTAVNNGRGREIRTPDILLPKQARYQAALYPDILYNATAYWLMPLKRCVYYSRCSVSSSILFGFFINKTKLLK